VFHSIRWRLVASYVLLTLLTASVVGLLASEIVRRIIRQQEAIELQANAKSMAEKMLPLLWVNAPDQQIHALTQAASFLGDVRVRILDADNGTLADSGIPGVNEELLLIYPPEGGGQLSLQNEIWFNLIMPLNGESITMNLGDLTQFANLPAGASIQTIERVTSPWGGRFTFELPGVRDEVRPDLPESSDMQAARSTIVVKEVIGDAEDPLGFVELSAGQDYGSAAFAATRRAFFLAGGGALFVALIVGLAISQRLTSPLRSLQETANRMGSGDLSARATFQRKDEIGDLAVQFNHMADQLQESFSRLENERDTLRRFISDASHELRTPVTALKNFLTLINGPAADDPPAQSEFLSESLKQVSRLEWITSNLLDLSRMDSGLLELDFAYHDLGTLVVESAAPYQTPAAEKEISIKIEEPKSPISLNCDSNRLSMVLSNLINNAIKFTPPGGEIEIGFAQHDEAIQIWVKDTGIGIEPVELPHIFDRFYRGRQHTRAGSGLGLAIAKGFVEAQGGSIQVESQIGLGTIIRMRFPVNRG
jgi:signal transduction histidine kinase